MVLKSFRDKKFFIYFKRPIANNVGKSSELIKSFGGQIEQFFGNDVNYVLTDILKQDWPPNGSDPTLNKACQFNVKLLSHNDLIAWCTKYINSPSSSDDDNEQIAGVKWLRKPFIKIEDMDGRYAPLVIEFDRWPELNTENLVVGKSFFTDIHQVPSTSRGSTTINRPNDNSAQLTQQVLSLKSNTVNLTPMPSTPVPGVRGVKRRHSVYCEICNQKLTDRIEEHIETQAHKDNIDKLDWSEVIEVIESLPGFDTLNRHRLSNLSIPEGIEPQEFLCLHKLDSVSQLFNRPSNRESNQSTKYPKLSPP